MGHKTTAQALREQLMAPRAIERVHAMHALELELEESRANPVADELEAFTARGIPYYAPEDPEYCEWVSKAVKPTSLSAKCCKTAIKTVCLRTSAWLPA